MTEPPTPVSGNAMELVEELRKWVNHNGGHDSSDYIRDIRVGVVIAAINEIERLQRIERNRDMWKEQCERQAERLRSQGGAPKGTLPKPVRERLDWTEYKFGECEECDERRNLGRDQNGALICGSCSDERYTAELEGYANALRATLSTDTKDGGGAHG